MRLHLGETKHRGVFRFFTGTISRRNMPEQFCYFEHPIRRMYGVSGSRARWFFGVIKTDATRDVRSSERPLED